MVTPEACSAEAGASSSASATTASSTPAIKYPAPLSGGVHSGSGVRRDAAAHELVSLPKIQCTHPVDCILNQMQPTISSHDARSAYRSIGLVPLVMSSANNTSLDGGSDCGGAKVGDGGGGSGGGSLHMMPST